MRIIAGEYRSRLLAAPRGMATRPTSDKLRGTLFNVLGPGIVGQRFADLYAGSGAVGIEAISRGAEFVWFAENAKPAAGAIRDNLRTLKIAAGYALEDRGAKLLLEALVKKSTALDVVFLDPPYEEEREYDATLGFLGRNAVTLLSKDALVIAEHGKKKPLAERYGRLVRTRVLEQGEAALSFYRVEAVVGE